MELFVHSQGAGTVEIVRVEESDLVATLVAEGSDDRVWIEEQVEEVRLDVSLVEAGVHHHHHVHRGHCHRLRADVRYETEHKHDELGPTGTVSEVLDWAVGEQGFNLPVAERPKYVLALPGADDYLASDVRLITLVGEDCGVRLDLLPKDHFGG